MSDEALRMTFSSNTLHRIAPTAWENSAIAHALLLQEVTDRYEHTNEFKPLKINGIEKLKKIMALQFRHPPINLDQVKKMTTAVGMIQFSKINQPDIDSGYTLDDNARALITLCMHFELTRDMEDLAYIRIYLDFISSCQQENGYFLNYVDSNKKFTAQNETTNLADANGRAFWALGYLVSKHSLIPESFVMEATTILNKALLQIPQMHATRAMAFTTKGLYYFNLKEKSEHHSTLIKILADRLLQMFRHESDDEWLWYESYLTYANSILPEAMLLAWLDTGDSNYRVAAKVSFDFLLSRTFEGNGIKVISNKTWLHKGKAASPFGEQPIDVAYTILALDRFFGVYGDENYSDKMTMAFSWFLGNNHLHQIIYNPCTGGCYDGLEENHVNLNQGAESTLSYLMARLTLERPLLKIFELMAEV